MRRQRAGWWLAALGIHALAWAGLQWTVMNRTPVVAATPPAPLQLSEVMLHPAPSERPLQTRPGDTGASPVRSPAPKTARPSERAGPSSEAPATGTATAAAVPIAASEEARPAPASAASLTAAGVSPGPTASPVASGAVAATPPSPTPSAASVTGAGASPPVAARAQGPRVDASWQGNEPPPYPLAARRRREEGTVRLDLLVEADGTVSQVRLRQSSGSPLLDRSVMQTVRHWRFVPARQDGQAIAAWYMAWEWVFRLEGGS